MSLYRSLLSAAAAVLSSTPRAMASEDDTQPVGENPIAAGGKHTYSTEFLGHQWANNSCSKRDLGFTGKLGGKWYAVYGDTLWCAPGITDATEETPGFHGMVRDSLSALTDDPLVVEDLHLNDDEPVPHQNQFVPFNEAWGETNRYGFGGTSIVETDAESATGALYYLVNAEEHYKGAGVAKVELVDGMPTVTKRHGDGHGYWWSGDETPKYGDVAAYRDERSDYIYILGNPPNSITDWPDTSYIYQARVRARDAFDLDKYEYWWGRSRGWKGDVLTKFDPTTAVMWGCGQGQMVWSRYFEQYIYVHMNGPSLCLRFAPSPGGPWTGDAELYTTEPIDGGFVYAGLAYPHLDESGKTLTVGWTNNNFIEILKITFD
ncbi:hypothetical protein GMORB2_7651 [Geosmithia morbida]|uniref:DUF4185 domain-containing protein n=1 Tax=Geosmithia morbida TaxID=1094350 RepID=A0A9P5CZW3_9HYPO|nr:uncharacterized protein GMORB2_7651 [Geosmithia morbida]KAF4122058.1 hypothetical protein GMORB2_7651 [Geosmithia morbida]